MRVRTAATINEEFVSSDVTKQLPLATISFANATPPRPTERALKVTNAAERRLERRGG